MEVHCQASEFAGLPTTKEKNMDYSINKPMTCQQAQHLVDAYILNDPSLMIEDRKNIESHLQNCPKCAQEYEKAGLVMNLVKKYWSGKTENQLIIERTNKPIEHRMTAKEGWKDLLQRCPDLAVTVKYQKRQRLLQRVSAVAACLVIGVSIFLAFSIYSKPEIVPKSTHQQVALASKPSVRIELISKNGNILIPANRQIVTNDELKTLIINGKHRLMMNTNTVLAVEPLVEHSNIGCQVKLASGQIYTHVQHDGNPFIVETSNAKSVITGTTFDVKATEDSTTLAVSEGTVQFESENGIVNVTAGQKSKILGQSAPSIPLSCNTAELTAWATGYKPGPALVQVESNTDPWYLPLPLGKEPIILEETDYDHWVEQNRDWFKQEFPWIFQLKDALAKEGIKADYPELLIKTGDVWQFTCLDGVPARFSVIDPNSLFKTASNYGFDKHWLLENVPAAKSVMEKPALSKNGLTDQKAFERWLEYLDETKGIEPPTPIYSYHASKYLAETRSLIWFAVRDGECDLQMDEISEVLVLLQEEVIAACNCQNEVLYPGDCRKSYCCEDKCQELVNSVIGNIKIIKAVERRISEYEISK